MVSEPRRTDVSAVVLAGGRSSRMGRPKALLPFGERPLIALVLDLLNDLCDDCIVVAGPDQELPALAARVVRDPVPHLGPVAGLAVGLAAARRSRAFVSSCDSPFLNLELVRWLLDQPGEWDVVIPQWQGRLNPLHAVYATSLAGRYHELLQAGRRRPVDLFPEIRVRTVPEEDIRRFDPEGRSFLNLNSPQEYRAALDLAARSPK